MPEGVLGLAALALSKLAVYVNLNNHVIIKQGPTLFCKSGSDGVWYDGRHRACDTA